MRHMPNLEELKELDNVWIYGPTRVGKSYWARHSHELTVYPK